jgi:hypothetical protein
MTMDNASYGRSRLVAGSPLPSSSITFGMTLVMAIACGVAAANIYYNQPMLGIMEAAFPGQVAVIGLVPTATQLGFAAGLFFAGAVGRPLRAAASHPDSIRSTYAVAGRRCSRS